MKVLIIILVLSSANCDCDVNQPTVLLKDRYYNGYYYYDEEYFVDNSTGLEYGCVCLKQACGRKCCPFGKAFDYTSLSCIDYAPRQEFNVSIHFYIGRRNCSESELMVLAIPFLAQSYFLGEDGYLYPGDNPEHILGPDKYCIDTMMGGVNDTNPEINPLICYKETVDYPYNYSLSSTCMLISCFFILLTVSVYLLIPELRNLYGMVLIAYQLSLFVSFIPLAALQIMSGRNSELMCSVTVYILYFSLLAAFFWLNVMCFDIWWTFSGNRSMGSNKFPRKRFYSYCVYAFGTPTALTILLAVLEHSDLGRPSVWRPNLRFHCFLKGKSALLYLYLPQSLTFIANIVFFILTTVKILSIRKLTTEMQKSVKDQQRFTLYIKLFAVMGINWTLEVISSFYPQGNSFWQFTDAYNDLVGLWTFIIFVCKKKTFMLIKKRLKQLRGGTGSDVTHKTTRTILQLQSQEELNRSTSCDKTK